MSEVSVDLTVCNASSGTEADFCATLRKFTTYEIVIKTNDQIFSVAESHIRRRYSEFCWLRKRLKQHHPALITPILPPKTIARSFHPTFIKARTQALETFLHQCLKEKLYLSDSAFHLFLQSPLTCNDIDRFLKGDITQQYVNSIIARQTSSQSDCSTDAGSCYGYDTDIGSANSIEATNND